jgi:hypothetical protein
VVQAIKSEKGGERKMIEKNIITDNAKEFRL